MGTSPSKGEGGIPIASSAFVQTFGLVRLNGAFLAALNEQRAALLGALL